VSIPFEQGRRPWSVLELKVQVATALAISTVPRQRWRENADWGLMAGGVSVHFLQKLAHCIELRTEAFPISGLQSLDCLIVAIERLLCRT